MIVLPTVRTLVGAHDVQVPVHHDRHNYCAAIAVQCGTVRYSAVQCGNQPQLLNKLID
jgi:hypothetical protein